MPGGCGDPDGVPSARCCSVARESVGGFGSVQGRAGVGDLVAPAGRLLGVVAGLAQPLPVGGGGVPAGGPMGQGVVAVTDRGVAPRGAAGLVAGDEEAAQPAGEGAAARVHGDQGGAVRGGVEPAYPHGGLMVGLGATLAGAGGWCAARGSAAVGVCGLGATGVLLVPSGRCWSRSRRHRGAPGPGPGPDPATAGIAAQQAAGQGGRDRSVAGQVGRLGAAGQQSGVGHHELDLDRHRGGVGLPGQPLDEGVGHDLAAGAAAGLPGADLLVGGTGQGGEARHTLGDRKGRSQEGHGVRGWAGS